MRHDWWVALRHRVDSDAVDAMEEIFGPGGNRDRIRYLRDIDALDEGTYSIAIAELPADVRTLIERVDLPSWLAEIPDLRRRQQRACDVFNDNALGFILGLLCKSLPECYAGARGSKVLARTGALGTPNRDHAGASDTMVRRVMETAVFVQNVMNWEMWNTEQLTAIRTIQKVRLFHAGVRVMIERHGQRDGSPWDYEADGIPINMQDTVATLLAFSQQSVLGARRLGTRISADDERSVLLHWIVIGHHLGLASDVLQEAWNQPYEMWEAVCNDEFRYSEDGDLLTSALRSFMRDHVFTLQHKRHVPLMYMQRLMDPRALKALRLDKERAASGLFYSIVFSVIFFIHDVLMAIPLLGPAITNWLGREMMHVMTELWAGNRPAQITLESELRSV